VARCGAELHTWPAMSPHWDIEADYLAQLCAQLVVTVSPQRIVLAGGVMSQLQLLPPVRERLLHWLGGYIDRAEILSGVEALRGPCRPGRSHRCFGCVGPGSRRRPARLSFFEFRQHAFQRKMTVTLQA